MLKEILRNSNSFLPSLGQSEQPFSQLRFLASGVFNKRIQAIVSSHREHVNRDRIADIEPKPDCTFELELRCRPLIDQDFLNAPLWQWFEAHLLSFVRNRATLQSCRSVTRTKELWSRSRRLLVQSPLMARTCSSPKISSGSYAKQRNGSPKSQRPSHRASSRSSRPDRLVSRFNIAAETSSNQESRCQRPPLRRLSIAQSGCKLV